MIVDVGVSAHGSVWLFHPKTPAALAWMDENVADDAPFFGDALACEPRYAGILAEGMQSDGLIVAKEIGQ